MLVDEHLSISSFVSFVFKIKNIKKKMDTLIQNRFRLDYENDKVGGDVTEMLVKQNHWHLPLRESPLHGNIT